MEENQSVASEVFWEVMGESVPSLILNGVDLILSIATVVFMVVGTIWLARSAKPGSRYLVLGLAGSIAGALVYAGYVLWSEESLLLEDFLSLFISVCTAMWGYGYLRLCGFLKREQGDRVAAEAPETSR